MRSFMFRRRRMPIAMLTDNARNPRDYARNNYKTITIAVSRVWPDKAVISIEG
jgi:hypothetical protein